MKYKEIIFNKLNDYIKLHPSIDIYDDYNDHNNIEYLLYNKYKIDGYTRTEKIKDIEDFKNKIFDAYFDTYIYYLNEYIEGFISSLKIGYQLFIDNHNNILDDIREEIENKTIVNYPIDSFLNDEIKINIFWLDNKNKSGFDDIFLKHLMRSQGYFLKNHTYFKKLLNNLHSYKTFSEGLTIKEKTQLEEDKKDKFLSSLIDEIENCYLDSPRDFCFIASITIENYFKLFSKKSFIIQKNAVCGLVDKYNGGGSILNIQLKKDIKINTCDISILIENIDKYTVNNIYGLTSNCFEDCIKF